MLTISLNHTGSGTIVRRKSDYCSTFLMTLVSFVRIAYKTKKRTFLRVVEIALAIKV